ncbi:phosphonopyruvate hydrolase [Bordetella holmesii]|uniref:Phosphonopyruvate hydrolase n=2 Tax=Bordetella holmesii TaxID=35814 RepID=A0A158MAH6_9BORD|nr:phosphonopyruvate hydrolase [Bordetella holmesii]AHV93407.1 phosphonopyruvate hydrolase [Bordetella holmesii ATCC 51541]AIT28409.1 phosphonopyruvate hydrolase [Bordetella holmesii 44057]EWM41200.1 phosphonopyruvate hydrolase [Bordetella holmesii 35009]EWM41491.1 phosphonopyruvate hydrolase [Bordetella holmesii 41130]EWM45090.1 phosphonopyruvate hydrolase [Bordetella holmesii 70147]
MNRHQVLRQALQEGRLLSAMAAHNPMAALLAEQAGFDAIWGSGFELCASYAVPDASILSLSVHVEMMRAIVARVSVPVIADIDTGFGNAVNVAYVLPQFEAAGVSAVVMEDKHFPKDTSLREQGRQDLLPIETFQGKIEAAVAARQNPDVLIVARVEALIAGLGQAEALTRATAYVQAGADAILIHSKQKTPDEILEFVRAWSGQAPLVLVPTAYPQLRESDIARLHKVGIVIYGNHAIRAAVGAMREVFARIRAEGGIAEVDAHLPTVKEIIALQGDAGMRELEKRFLR